MATIVNGQNIGSTAKTLSINKLKLAVEANPDNIKANEDYLDAIGINDPLLPKQYQIWMQRFPKSAVLPFEIGKIYETYSDTVCRRYLLKAIQLNPNFAAAWEYLSYYETALGDQPMAIAFMKKATEIDPQNVSTAFHYAALHSDADPALYDSLMLKIVYHFPGSEKGAEALSLLASNSYNLNEKVAYYEELYNMYSNTQYAWYRAGMKNYYDYLINISPDKAFELALKVVLRIKVNRGDWNQKLNVARSFIEARNLLNMGKSADAENVLSRVNLGNSKKIGLMIDAEETLALFRAEATDACDKTFNAYNSIASYYSKQPSERLYDSLIKYGKKLGIDKNKVDSTIWKLRDSTGWKVTDFTLESYADHKNISLSDFRGKVVLLTFWYPTCEPCRKEFSHIEAVLKKINNNSVVYLGINILRQEEKYVMPLVKSKGYTFIPLQDTPNKQIGNLPQVNSTPTNFLIDKEGKVIFTDFSITDKNENTLELMITDLLKRER